MAGWTCKDREEIEWDGTIKSNFLGTTKRTPTEELHLVNKEYVDNVATKSVIDLFLTENASDVGGYFDLEVNVVTAAKEDITQSITANSTTLIASFVSKLAEDSINEISILENGVYNLHIHASGAIAKKLFVYFEFYHRTAGGTETLLGTSHVSDELGTSETQNSTHAVVNTEKAFISGDRIVVKVYGRNDSAAARNVTIYMEGDTASRIEFPAVSNITAGVIDHSALNELDFASAAHTGFEPAKGADDNFVTDADVTNIATLTDNSMADTLHRHSELSANDGTPDQALTVDAMGRVNISYDLIVDSDLLFVDVAPGYVGIGTNTPGEMLDVVGNAEINGNIIVTGTVDGVDIAARDHAESHTVASHNDTTGTGAELNTLTGGGETALHSHAGGGGDVSAAANLTNNAIVRGDGGAKGVQTSTAIIDDNGNLLIENLDAFFGLAQIEVKDKSGSGHMDTLFGLFHLYNSNSSTGITIDGSDDVGIGTASPGSKLEVTGNAAYTATTDMGADDEDFASKKYVDDQHLVYDTGWINRSLWLNKHLGSNTTLNTDSNVTHNLDAPLADLLVKVLISTNGTDANSFQTEGIALQSGVAWYGTQIDEVDSDNILVQTGAGGIYHLNTSGNGVLLDTESWYYKIVVYKIR